MLAVTYEKIEKRSDVEWKFGRAKLIRNLTNASSDVPSPFILFTQLFKVIMGLVKFRGF